MITSKKALALTAAAVLAAGAGATVAANQDAASAEEVVIKVRAAAKLLHDKGISAFAEINEHSGRWVWKDSYVFAYDCRQNRMLAHPLRPDLVGQPLMQITDNSGKLIFRELCKAGGQPRGGWVEYLWTKPGAGNASRKLSYALAADVTFSSGIQVGAGIYDEKITLADLDKLTERLSDPTKYPAH